MTDHKSRNRSDITTIYGGLRLGPSIVIIAITLESGEMSHNKSRNRLDITTIYGGLGPSIVIIAITLESIAIRNRSDIRTTGSFDQYCIYTNADTLKSGDVVIPMGLDNSSLISVNSDRSHIRVAQNISIIELQYATRTDEGPDHFWSSNRNFNEVNYAFQDSIDDKSRVLFDEPIVWPATQLVPTMDQMLASPGTK